MLHEVCILNFMSWLSDFFPPPAASIPLPQSVPFCGSIPGVTGFSGSYPSSFGYSAAPSQSAYSPTGFSGAEGGMLGGIGNLSNFNLYPTLRDRVSHVRARCCISLVLTSRPAFARR
jgi:hypothetical protein